MSTPTGSLKTVIDHCRHVRDDSIAAQARVQMDLGTALRTLQTLEQYRDEQLQRARDSRSSSAPSPLSRTHLLLQTRFSDKLEEAITLQSKRVADLRHHVENCRAQVLALQQRLKAIEAIEAQRLNRARWRAARADQAEADEHAANTYAQRARQAAEMAAEMTAKTAADNPHNPH